MTARGKTGGGPSARSAAAREAGRTRKSGRATTAARAGPPFIVLTGLSGSGKSQAIRALEDLGYFCVDNLPTTLIPTLAKLSQRGGRGIDKVAIVVDVREGGFLSSFPTVFRQLR
jgi:50S ribosomal subunit-associated GTPase HflX